MNQSSNVTYSYGAYDRLTSMGSSVYTYDNVGNLKSSSNGTYSYSYDYENRLIQVKQGNILLATYAYTPDGVRIQKIENGITTVYLNRGVDVLYEKQTTGGSLVNYYIFDRGLLIGKLSGGNAYYFHTDALGSVRLVSIGSATSFSGNYQPFGLQYGSTGTDPTYKYARKPQDSATGLYYFGARYYDQNVGRFITRDPFRGSQSSPKSSNPYSYVSNNPETLTDPTGACIHYFDICEAAAGVILSIIGFGWLQRDLATTVAGAQFIYSIGADLVPASWAALSGSTPGDLTNLLLSVILPGVLNFIGYGLNFLLRDVSWEFAIFGLVIDVTAPEAAVAIGIGFGVAGLLLALWSQPESGRFCTDFFSVPPVEGYSSIIKWATGSSSSSYPTTSAPRLDVSSSCSSRTYHYDTSLAASRPGALCPA